MSLLLTVVVTIVAVYVVCFIVNVLVLTLILGSDDAVEVAGTSALGPIFTCFLLIGGILIGFQAIVKRLSDTNKRLMSSDKTIKPSLSAKPVKPGAWR